MRPGSRTLWLFAIAVILPSLILAVIGTRLLTQERELNERRMSEQQQRLAGEAAQTILSRAASEAAAEVFQNSLNEDSLQAFRGSRAPGLVVRPATRNLARFYQAWLTARDGRTSEAIPIYAELLRSPVTNTDEAGMPVRWLAAQQLSDTGLLQEEVLNTLTEDLRSDAPVSQAHVALLRKIVERLAKRTASRDDAARLDRLVDLRQNYLTAIQQAMALRPSSTWRIVAPDPKRFQPWLVQRTRDVVVALRLGPLSRGLQGQVQLHQPQSGQDLGPDLPDLTFALAPDVHLGVERRLSLLWWFFLAAFALVLSISILGVYLLWRDVNREMRVAEERAQFVAGVSHELRTPLTAIQMYAETLTMGRAPSKQVEQEYLETILAEGDRLARLVDNVLDFAKVGQGKKLYRFQSTSLPDVVRDAARAMERPLAQKGFDLKIDVDDTVEPIRADHDALVRATLNLLSNAMKYSGDSRRVELRLTRRKKHALIRVKDYGFGLPQEEQERVFEKFYRAPQPEGRNVPGTGLGLTLVQHVAEAHGGSVEVRSEPGQGSVFSIVLPMEEIAA